MRNVPLQSLKASALLSLCFLLMASAAWGQTHYSRASGDWNDPNTWSTIACDDAAATSFPTPGSNVIICNTHIVNLNINATCSNLTVNAGATLNLGPGLTVNGVSTVNGTLRDPENNTGSFSFGAITVGTGGDFGTGENTTSNSTYIFRGNISSSNLFRPRGGNYTFEGAAPITIRNNNFTDSNMQFGRSDLGTCSVNQNVTLLEGAVIELSALGGINIAAGRTLTNQNEQQGTATSTLINANIIGAGTFINDTNAFLIFRGNNVTVTNFNVSSNNNTFWYNGAAQSIRSAVYHDLWAANAFTKSLTGPITVNGNLRAFSNAVLDVADVNNTIDVKALFNLSGGASFVHRGGTVTFTGAEAITGDAAATEVIAFFNVVINKTNTTDRITFNSPATVAGTLTLTRGVVLLNNGDLRLTNTNPINQISPATPTANSYVANLGFNTRFLVRQNLGTGNYIFPVGSATQYQPVTLPNPASTASVRFGTPTAAVPNSGAGSWFINNGGVAFNVTFNNPQGANITASSAIHRYNTPTTGTWNALPTSAVGSNYTASTLIGTVVELSIFTPLASTHYSRASGNWNDPNTWSTVACGGMIATSIPTAIDDVVICAAHTVTLNAVSSCNNLTINAGAILNPTEFNFTVGGLATINGTFIDSNDAGANLFDNGITIGINGIWNTTSIVSNGINMRVRGTITHNNAAPNSFRAGVMRFVAGGTLNGATGAAKYLINTLEVTSSGFGLINNHQLEVQNMTLFPPNGSFVQGPNSVLQFRDASILTRSTDASTNFSTNPNTVEYIGGSGNVFSNVYRNLNISTTGTKTLTGSILVNGNFAIADGTFDATANSHQFFLRGNWTASNGTTFLPGNATVTFDGSTTQSISIISSALSLWNLVIENTAPAPNNYVDLLSPNELDVRNMLNIRNGRLRLNNRTFTYSNPTAPPVNSSGWVETNGTGTFRLLSNLSNFTFPVGSAAQRQLIQIANPIPGASVRFGAPTAPVPNGGVGSWFVSNGTTSNITLLNPQGGSISPGQSRLAVRQAGTWELLANPNYPATNQYQAGNVVFSGATREIALLTPSTQSINFNLSSPQALTAGSIPLSATASSGLPVTFSSSNPEVASVLGNILTFHTTGTVSITASQAGGGIFAPAADVTRVIEVVTGTIPQSITFRTELLTRAVGDPPFRLEAVASPDMMRPVSFSSSNPEVATITEAEGTFFVNINGAGRTEITASQAGDAVYLPAEVSKNLLVIVSGNESAASLATQLYPNPASREVEVVPALLFGAVTYRLQSAQGHTLWQERRGDALPFRFSVEALPKGIYFLHIQNAQESFVKKIVKE